MTRPNGAAIQTTRDRVERPRIVGLGGTTRASSSTERALRVALTAAERGGAEVVAFTGRVLAALPLFAPESTLRTPDEQELIEAVRTADGLIIATPGYHGGMSGLMKNALDLLEELREDERPYLTGRAIGCIVTASGWQACTTTLVSLRSVGHALRGWPTPLGATVNTSLPIFADDGACTDPRAAAQLETVGAEVVQFARMIAGARA
jgi:FMN reductase